MVGKILIVKSLMASKFSYIGSVIDLPESFVNRVNGMFFKFVWGGSEKVKRTALINEYASGGLKMLHLKIFLDSLKLSWIKKLISPDICTWKNIPLYNINKTHLGIHIFKCNCSFENINGSVRSMINEMPIFYANLIKVWLSTKFTLNTNQVDLQNWGNQVIWNNVCITDRGKTLYFKEWVKKGFVHISDLYDQNGEFLLLDDIKIRFAYPGSIWLQYSALKQAIPNVWKKKTTKVNSNDVFFL
jgi:hypothetical protein